MKVEYKVKKINPNYPVKVLDKSLSILETLLQRGSLMSITEISNKLEMYPSTVHRILDTLKSRGYVEQEPQNQKYQLGLKLVELGMAKFHKIDLIEEAIPFLKELVNQCNETVHLGIFDQGKVLYLAKEEPDQNIRMVSQVGKRAPVYSTSLGKILLAYLPKDERKVVTDKIKYTSFTKNTINNKEKLEEELDKVKKQGFALDKEENEKGVCCTAAPIRNYQGKVIAAISISSPVYRINIKKQKCLRENIVRISRKISKRLGYNGK